MPKDVFVVLGMTSPDQSCHIILCSSYLSVNSAPGGPDYALCLPLNCLFALSTSSQSIYSWNWWFNEEFGHHEWPLSSLQSSHFFLFMYSSFGWIIFSKLQNLNSFVLLHFLVLQSSIDLFKWQKIRKSVHLYSNCASHVDVYLPTIPKCMSIDYGSFNWGAFLMWCDSAKHSFIVPVFHKSYII